MIKNTGFSFLIALFIITMAYSRPGGSWLEIGGGGRAAGLAEAMTAGVEGASATYWNPAALGLNKKNLEATYSDNFDGCKSQYISGDFDISKHKNLAIGFSILHVGSGDLELRSQPSSEPEGHFEARQYALGLNLAYYIPQLKTRLGIGGRYLSDAIYIYHANGWSLDLGLLRQGFITEYVDLGLTARHIGKMKALKEEAYDLPTTFAGGVKINVPEFSYLKSALFIEAAKVADEDISLRSAIELKFQEIISLRTGYMSGIDSRGLTYGFGIHWHQWKFDYGYIPFDYDLGNSQRLSVGVAW